MSIEELFEGVYRLNGRIATKNLTKGRKVYGEELLEEGRTEYRMWNPYRSKLCAAILKGIGEMHIASGSKVLYLGAATGTTSSHVSDIVGKTGSVYCVEISERNMRVLVELCEERSNMLPIMADALEPDDYLRQVGTCDVIYQDISVKEQAEIMLKNCGALKKGGYAYFIIKSQSIDISRDPQDIYKEELRKLKGRFTLVESTELEPYDSKHLFAVLRKVD